MKFEYALKAMRDGKKVRKLDWGSTESICLDESGDVIDECNQIVTLSLSTCIDTEWEIYTEPKKKKTVTKYLWMNKNTGKLGTHFCEDDSPVDWQRLDWSATEVEVDEV